MARGVKLEQLPRWLPPLALFVVALAVRLVAVRSATSDPFFFGKYLVLGEALRDSGFIALRPFSYAPIYTYFIAFARLFFGDSVAAILVTQAVVGSVGCVLILLVAREWLGPRWAWLPAGVACVYHSFVLYDVTFLSDSLGLVLQLALLWRLLRLTPASRWPSWAAVGSLVGLSILHRPNNLLLLPLIVVVALVPRASRHAVWRRVALAAGVALLVTMPVVLQNLRLTGTPGVTASNPGYILYSSNNGSSYGFRYSPPELFYRGTAYYESRGFETRGSRREFMGDAEIATMISGAVEGRPMSLSESSRYYRRVVMWHVSRYPLYYVRLLAHKVRFAFNGFESHDVLPVFVRSERIASLAPVRFGWIAPLGLLGLALSLRRWREFVWLYVLLLNNLVLLTAFYVVVRFRLPLEAMLLLTAGLAVARIAGWVRDRRFAPLAACAAVLAVLAVVCNTLPASAAERARARGFEVMFEDAQRRATRGDVGGAVERLERLIGEDDEDVPRSFEAHRLLARLYAGAGAAPSVSAMKPPSYFDPSAVIGRIEDKRREGRATFQELRYLAFLYGQAERWNEARAVLTEALERRPPEPLTRYERARAAWSMGDAPAAARDLALAMEDGLLFTSSALDGAMLLAEIYRERGEPERAAGWVRQAARLSILAPWFAGDPEIERVLARLRSLPGWVEPGPIETLIPLRGN